MTILEAQKEKLKMEIAISDMINSYIEKYKLNFERINAREIRNSGNEVVSVQVQIDFEV